jgi:hypothetical protein
MPNPSAERETANALGAILLGCYASNVIELRSTPVAFTLVPGERPVASPLVRLQARCDEPLSSLRHTLVSLEPPLARALLRLMDGTRTRAELAEALRRETSIDSAPNVGLEDVERMVTEFAAMALLSA